MTALKAPPVQPCCQKHHALPFQHRRYYVDKRGRSRYVLECSRCYRTLPERGLKPGNIRWTKGADPYCEVCAAEINAEMSAPPTERVCTGCGETYMGRAGGRCTACVFGRLI